MARSRTLRLTSLTLSNLLLPIAVLVFASGFFPYKPLLPGLATFDDVQEPRILQPEAVFDRVVFVVVDALRSDFVYGYNSGFEFTQSLIRSGAAIPFTAHATPPTVTMPRVKALTTGSVPSFLDLIMNFAESDTTSALATQDTWLAQIKARGGNLVFYGDDTWLKLFPGDFFERSDGTSSFFVSDFTEVDNNVTRHVADELARDDWDAMIMHYLGLDHIGHKTGPQGPNMLPKQREMDGIVQQIYKAMETEKHHSKTLLVLAGDHGMNAGGNHGGSGAGETDPALLFASSKFKEMPKRRDYECPTRPKDGTEFHYYTKIEQSDLVPALAGMMGFPVPKNSLGVLTPELAALWSASGLLQLLRQNANQLLHIIRAKYGAETFDAQAAQHSQEVAAAIAQDEWPCKAAVGDEQELAYEWGEILHFSKNSSEEDFYRFLNHAQAAMSDTASSYDIPLMIGGMVISATALAITGISYLALWPPSPAGLSFATVSLLYGVMMFASSYIEEEQHFWYWLTPAWITVLLAKGILKMPGSKDRLKIAAAGAILFATHRLAVRWNQTGQKHAGEPDIVHAVFPGNHILMWILILTTYISTGFLLHNRTFAGIFMPELAAFADVALIVPAMVFKLNFTQADAPELVRGLAMRIREWTEPFSLVLQARVVFAALAVTATAVVVLSISQARTKGSPDVAKGEARISLSERLHHLLTLFLMTQTRAPNVPLFLALDLQRLSLGLLLGTDDTISEESSTLNSPDATAVATSVLLLSYVYYFCMGGSNSISSIDLSNAYNGVADYNIAAVGLLLFASNWTGPMWWCSAAVLIMVPRTTKSAPKQSPLTNDERDWVMVERAKLQEEMAQSTKANVKASGNESSGSDPWLLYITSMTTFIASSLLAVMAACTALRTHLFIWTVFSPKYLYAMAWSVGWHLIVNVGLGSVLYRLVSVA